MEIPDPDDVPSQKFRAYLSNLAAAIRGIRPIAGDGISISEFPGQGTTISVDKTAGCTPGDPPASGTYVWGAVNGVCGWIATTTCP